MLSKIASVSCRRKIINHPNTAGSRELFKWWRLYRKARRLLNKMSPGVSYLFRKKSNETS
jgi:uncharacterized protein YjiS (DUF1127 family)